MAEIETVVDMSAQHLRGTPVDEDGVLSFWMTDDETGIGISHDVGDPMAAAEALDGLAAALREHAATIRRRAQLRRGLHGPLTGPVAWPR